MYIVRFALITFVAFALMMGCSMVSKEVDMSKKTMTADTEPMNEVSVPTPKKSAYQEVTLNVEGMT